MCGIVGILGKEAVATQVVEALRRLEYRGYDSAGVATLEHGQLTRRRAEGKLKNLEVRLSSEPLEGLIGIGHTRWATHGKRRPRAMPIRTPPTRWRWSITASSRTSASCSADLARPTAMSAQDPDRHGDRWRCLVTRELDRGLEPRRWRWRATPEAAARRFRPGLHVRRAKKALLIGCPLRRLRSPSAYGDDRDVSGVRRAWRWRPFTSRLIAYLRRWRLGRAQPSNGVDHPRQGSDQPSCSAEPMLRFGRFGALLVDKGNHRHFMAKEIYEQPETVVGHTLSALCGYEQRTSVAFALRGAAVRFRRAQSRLTISACGTASYAGHRRPNTGSKALCAAAGG